jgi:hypothetical protein
MIILTITQDGQFGGGEIYRKYNTGFFNAGNSERIADEVMEMVDMVSDNRDPFSADAHNDKLNEK